MTEIEVIKLIEEREDRHAKDIIQLVREMKGIRAENERMRELLREVYTQAGNSAPAERRHVLTAELRDAIRDALNPGPAGEQEVK